MTINPPDTSAGIGDANAWFNVYIGNRPDYSPFDHTLVTVPVEKGQIYDIGRRCGNGWRKVFNVYAKLVFSMGEMGQALRGAYPSWQHYRDATLLASESNTALLFTPPRFSREGDIHVIMGKHYALSLALPFELEWLDHEFAINLHHRCIV